MTNTEMKIKEKNNEAVIGNDIVTIDDFLKSLEKVTKIKYKLEFDFSRKYDPTSDKLPDYAYQSVMDTKIKLLEPADDYEKTVYYKMNIVPDGKTVEKKGVTEFKKKKKYKYDQVRHQFAMKANLLDRTPDGYTRFIDHITEFSRADLYREVSQLKFGLDKDPREVFNICLTEEQFKNCDPIYIKALDECYKEKAKEAAAEKKPSKQDVEPEIG